MEYILFYNHIKGVVPVCLRCLL